MEAALADAVEMLSKHFDRVDPQAAVALAGLLYSTREREGFLERHPNEPETVYP